MCLGDRTILTYRELRAGGMTRAAVAAAKTAGTLVWLRRGVYASSESCVPAREAARHGGTLACVSAARHSGLWVLDEDSDVHVWLRGDRHRYAHDGCGCIEHWDHGTSVEAFGPPSVPRVLRQLLGCRGAESFFVALESALRRGLLSDAGLLWLRLHTNDAGREALDYARADADSGLESLLRWRLRRHGLSVRTQVRVDGVGRVDFLIGDRLIVEVDGRENHDGESLRHKDLFRDANAAMWGYAVLRFDYALVVHDWELVERAILGHVQARAEAQLRG